MTYERYKKTPSNMFKYIKHTNIADPDEKDRMLLTILSGDGDDDSYDDFAMPMTNWPLLFLMLKRCPRIDYLFLNG